MSYLDLKKYGITVSNVIRNISPAVLYEEALQYEKLAAFSDTGALMIRSGQKNRT